MSVGVTDDLLKAFIGKLVAREIEWVAELARQFGYKFPRQYDVGVAVTLPQRITETSLPVRVRIRLGSVVRTVELNLLARETTSDSDAWPVYLAREASYVVQQWLDANPLIHPPRAQMEAFLARRADSSAMIARVNEVVRTARYEVR